jgi:hypothetical protein
VTTLSKRKRKLFYVTDEMQAKIEAKAREYGVTQSAFVSFCVAEYLKQCDALNVMDKVDSIFRAIGKPDLQG